MIKSFRHRELHELLTRGKSATVPPELRKKCLNRLTVLHRPPIHPGEIFAEEVMPELRKKRTIGEIARVLGVSRQNLYRMMQRKVSLTPDMAAKIGALVGNGARIWLAIQADYDAWEATKRLAPALKKIRAEA
jgi:addiction module HigA family antidote